MINHESKTVQLTQRQHLSSQSKIRGEFLSKADLGIEDNEDFEDGQGVHQLFKILKTCRANKPSFQRGQLVFQVRFS